MIRELLAVVKDFLFAFPLAILFLWLGFFLAMMIKAVNDV